MTLSCLQPLVHTGERTFSLLHTNQPHSKLRAAGGAAGGGYKHLISDQSRVSSRSEPSMTEYMKRRRIFIKHKYVLSHILVNRTLARPYVL